MSTSTGTLATFEVAVRRAGTALTRRKNVGVHAQAHGTASLSPLETGILEDLVKTLLFSLLLHQAGTGHDHDTLEVRSGLLSLDNVRRNSQILDASVGTRSDEDLVENDIGHLGTCLETHVLEGTFARLLLVLVIEVVRSGNNTSDANNILRRSTPGDCRLDVLSIDENVNVEFRVFVSAKAGPVFDSLLPLGRVDFGGKRPALEVLERGLVRCNHTSACATLNCHVAN